MNKDKYKSVTGYTSQHESPHDFFTVGHTSTSISLACGLAKARDLKNGKENIVAIIGDGSLSGGEAYEGLNNAAASGKNIIILVNDNDMSIAENHGGLYKNLKELRDTNGKAENNFFKALGFEYHYVAEGNNVGALIEVFKNVKDTDKPVVVHMHTIKGKGYKDAEINKEAFHWVMPFYLETKKPLMQGGNTERYSDVTDKFLMEKAAKDDKIVGITAATPAGVGFKEFRTKFKDQYIDVGIAEEHAIALASGIASQGGKPVAIKVPNMAVVSTGEEVEANFDDINKYVKTIDGSEVAILGLGAFYHLGKKVHEKLKNETGINATLINPRFITGVDEELLTSLLENHKLVITLEDGVLDGGFGEKIARFYGDKTMKTLNFGATKEFTDSVPVNELYERYHLKEELIIEDIKNALK